MQRRTTDELVATVREDLDEANTEDVQDSEILKKLNRAQRRAVNLVVPNYDELFLASTTVTTVDGQYLYDMPTDIYGQRLEFIQQILDNDRPFRLTREANRTASDYERFAASSRLSFYSIVHNQFKVFPKPKAGLTLKVWYTRQPEQLVLSQGRVVAFGIDSNTSKPYITVDTLGDELTTSATSLNNYVNVIDHRTGKVKGSLQVASINTTTKRVLFKDSSLTRTSVLGKTVSTELPTDLIVDDYICTVHGTCVPEIPEAYTDYLTQYAVVAIKRSKGEPNQEDYADLKEQADDISTYWKGREASIRVTRSNPFFKRNRRSFR